MTASYADLVKWNTFWAPYREALQRSTLSHRIWDENWSRLYTSLSSRSGKITAIIGPTGIGKTTLVKRVCARWLADIGAPDDRLVFVSMKRPKGNRQSSEKDLMARIMNSIRFPGLTVRDLPQELHAEVAKTRKWFSASMMEECLVEFARQNPTVLLVIEEIQHAADSDEKSFIEDMSALKTVVDAGMNVLVTGGYAGLKALENDAHLKSRVSVIHFPPYPLKEEGCRDFNIVLDQIEDILPPGNRHALISHFSLVYNKCLGNVGALVSLTHAAITNACAHGKSVIDEDCIVPFQLEATARDVLLKEYAIGEKRYGPLGFRKFSSNDRPEESDQADSESTTNNRASKSSKGKPNSKAFRAAQTRSQTGDSR